CASEQRPFKRLFLSRCAAGLGRNSAGLYRNTAHLSEKTFFAPGHRRFGRIKWRSSRKALFLCEKRRYAAVFAEKQPMLRNASFLRKSSHAPECFLFAEKPFVPKCCCFFREGRLF